MKIEITITEARTIVRALRIYHAVVGATELTQASNDRIWSEHKRSGELLNRIAAALPAKLGKSI